MRQRIAVLMCSTLLLTAAVVEGQVRRTVSSSRERLKTEADQAYQKGDYAKVVELTSTVISQDPNDHVAYYLRGSARVEIGLRTSDAGIVRSGIADARQSIAVNGARNPLYYLPYLYGMTSLTKIEGRKDHAEVSIKIADQALALKGLTNEQKSHLLYQRAMARSAIDKTNEAVGDFQAAIRLVSNHLGAHLAMADALAKGGQNDRATAAFQAAARTFPSNPLVFNNYGMFLQQTGKYQEAVNQFTKAMQLNGRYFYAVTNRGFALLQGGNPKAAEADFTASLKINPQQPGVYGLRGSARIAQGDLKGGVEDNLTAVRMDPKNPSAHAELGFALFFAERYKEARTAFDEAVKLNADFSYVDPWRYWTLVKLGRKSDAEKIAATRPSAADAKTKWTEQLLGFSAGKVTEDALIEAAGKAPEAARKPHLCEAHFFIGLQKSQAGLEQRAREHFQKAISTDARALAAFRGARLNLQRLTAANDK